MNSTQHRRNNTYALIFVVFILIANTLYIKSIEHDVEGCSDMLYEFITEQESPKGVWSK